MSETLREALYQYTDQEKMHCWEGRRGLQNLCKLCRALGYHDPLHFGQLTPDAAIGDLTDFLEDNSGCIEAIIEWVGKHNFAEWKEAIESKLYEEEENEQESTS